MTVFRGDCGPWKTLGSLSDVHCLTWGIPALKSAGCWVGLYLSIKAVAFGRTHTNEYCLVLLSPVSLSPQWTTATPASPVIPPRSADRSGPVSYEVTGSQWAQDFVCTFLEWSLLPPILWNFCNQAMLAFNAKCSGGLSSWCQTPRLGSLMWGSEFSLLWE